MVVLMILVVLLLTRVISSSELSSSVSSGSPPGLLTCSSSENSARFNGLVLFVVGGKIFFWALFDVDGKLSLPLVTTRAVVIRWECFLCERWSKQLLAVAEKREK